MASSSSCTAASAQCRSSTRGSACRTSRTDRATSSPIVSSIARAASNNTAYSSSTSSSSFSLMSFRWNHQQYSYAYAYARTMDTNSDDDDADDGDDDGMTRYHASEQLDPRCSMQTYPSTSPQWRARWTLTVMMTISDITCIRHELRPVVIVVWSPSRLSDIPNNIR